MQVFGRRDDGLTTRSGGQKRQGAQIAGGVWRRCRGRYGDFAPGSGLLGLHRSRCRDRLAAKSAGMMTWREQQHCHIAEVMGTTTLLIL